VILSIRRPEGNRRPTLRAIHCFSRDSGESNLTIELKANRYISHGAETAVAFLEACSLILSAAAKEKESALTRDEFVERAGIKSTTGRRVIEKFLKTGQLLQTGGGKKNDPYRYWIGNEME
jgi:hypothetical protein